MAKDTNGVDLIKVGIFLNPWLFGVIEYNNKFVLM